MRESSEFFVGLLERGQQAAVSVEDFTGPHGPMLRLWQQAGVIDSEPGTNPAGTCPYCEEGTPYRLGEQLLCNHCRSHIDPSELLLWRVSMPAFLRWVAEQWKLKGGVRQIDASLWQLGTCALPLGVFECFYRRNKFLSEAAKARLSAFHRSILLSGRALVDAEYEGDRHSVTMLELLRSERALSLADPTEFLRIGGKVRFDAGSGALWVGATLLGEVPVGSKEHSYLDRLARDIDSFVSYQDLKAHVLRLTGSRDSTEEATFCQNLKSRIKKKWVQRIDRLIATTNKADGYRLRGYAEL